MEIGNSVGADVSTLGSMLTTSENGLLKNLKFTYFCNKRVYRYAKYWDPRRDSPVNSALAKFCRENWWDGYVKRETQRLPPFEEWWFHNGFCIRQRINQKRSNDTGRIRKTFKGKCFD